MTPFGRYQLERRIASGGMADVYLARQTGAYGFEKRVAVKVLKREIAGDDANVTLFIREALVAAEFRHPNLAQVYEVGEVDGRLFIAMELVRGVSVAALLRGLSARGKAMPLNVAVRIAIDTLDGLSHAHEARGADGTALGLVHRDVSPQNVMVAVDGTVKVVDFGIARAESLGEGDTAPRLKGKFAYMPPEQWDARGTIDARADLFAVGVLLYEMTTGGARLFQGDSPKDLYRAIVLEPIAHPRTRSADYPAPLAAIVLRALERGPGARWPSARAMRTALVEFGQAQGWSLSSRAVADTLRDAIGAGDVEARWEPVDGAAGSADATDPNAPSAEPVRPVTVPTIDARPPGRPLPRRALASPMAPGARPRLLALPLVVLVPLALLAAGGAGVALGRRASPAVALRVRVAAAVPCARGSAGAALLARYRAAHPEVALELVSAAPDAAFASLVSGAVEVALLSSAPEAAARARGGVALMAVTPALYVATRGAANGAARSMLDWLRAPDTADVIIACTPPNE